MLKIVVLAFCFLFCACYVNERGISARYYNDCREYYDAAGVYHKACDENIVDFSDAKKLVPNKKSKAELELENARAQEKDFAELDRVEEQIIKEEEEKARQIRRQNLQRKNQSELESRDF